MSKGLQSRILELEKTIAHLHFQNKKLEEHINWLKTGKLHNGNSPYSTYRGPDSQSK
jgi:hypothetical protein